MKKFLAILLGTMVLSLAACGNETKNEASGEEKLGVIGEDCPPNGAGDVPFDAQPVVTPCTGPGDLGGKGKRPWRIYLSIYLLILFIFFIYLSITFFYFFFSYNTRDN